MLKPNWWTIGLGVSIMVMVFWGVAGANGVPAHGVPAQEEVVGTAVGEGPVEGPSEAWPIIRVQDTVPMHVHESPVEFEPVVLRENKEEAPDDAPRSRGHEVLGLVVHPYTALTLSRVQGQDYSHGHYDDDDCDRDDYDCRKKKANGAQWSTGFKFGVEIDAGSLYIGAEFQLRDILTDAPDTYPWDGEFELAVGGYW